MPILKLRLILAGLIFLCTNAYSQNAEKLYLSDSLPLQVRVAGKLSAFAAPAAFITYGLVAQQYKAFKRVDLNVKADVTEDYPGFKNHLDDKLQYIPTASVYALSIAGIKGKNNFIDKTALFFISNTIMSMSVDFIKTQSHKLRPDGSDYRAFPSGHTATAFAAAEFMAQEYKGVSPWYAIAGYGIATATGTLRMLNNKHWFSDVVTGAGVGILSTKLAYVVYPLAKKCLTGKKTSRLTIMPEYENRFWACAVNLKLD